MADEKKIPNPTLDADKPITPLYPGEVIARLQRRVPDRSPKDILTWRAAIIAAESVYYPNQQRLFDLYDDILFDGHLRGIIRKHFASIVNKGLFFQKNEDRDKDFDPLIKSKPFRTLCVEILWTMMWGISGMEFIPGKKFAWKKVPRKHIKLKTQKITFEQTGLDDGIDYTDLWNVWILGENGDLGLLAAAAQYALYKRGDLADWANYIELFGMPTTILKYDAYDEQTKMALTKILDDQGNMLRLMIPKQADYERQENNSSNGTGDLQGTFLDAMNKEMDVLLLGGTESTTSSKSSGYGQSKVHSDQHKEIVRFDMDYLLEYLNSDQFHVILKSYGYNTEGGQFDFTKELDIDYLSARAEKIDLPLLKAGFQYSKKFIQDTYGVPEPESADDIFKIIPMAEPALDPEEPESDPANPKQKQQTKKRVPPKSQKNLGYYLRKISGFFD